MVFVPVEGIERICEAPNATLAVLAETSKVAAEAIDILDEVLMLPAPDNFSVPEMIEVAPVYEFEVAIITELFVVAPVFTICKGFAPVMVALDEKVIVPVEASPDVPM